MQHRDDWSALERDCVSAHLYRADIPACTQFIDRLRQKIRHILERHACIARDVLNERAPARLNLRRHGVHAGVNDPIGLGHGRPLNDRCLNEVATAPALTDVLVHFRRLDRKPLSPPLRNDRAISGSTGQQRSSLAPAFDGNHALGGAPRCAQDFESDGCWRIYETLRGVRCRCAESGVSRGNVHHVTATDAKALMQFSELSAQWTRDSNGILPLNLGESAAGAALLGANTGAAAATFAA